MKVTFQIEFNPACISAVKLFQLIVSMGMRLKIKKIELQSRQMPIKVFPEKYTMDEIKDIVCHDAGVSENEFKSKTRKQEVVDARYKAMFFCRKLTPNSVEVIGSEYGNKNHATVSHACKNVINMANTNRKYRSNLEKLLFDITKGDDFQLNKLLE